MDPEVSTDPDRISQGVRILAMVLGLAIIAFGFFFAAKLLASIYTAVQEPQQLETYVSRWTAFLGGEPLTLEFDGLKVDLTRKLAILFLGVGTLVLVHISMGFMSTGARVVGLVAGENRAMNQLVRHLQKISLSSKSGDESRKSDLFRSTGKDD